MTRIRLVTLGAITAIVILGSSLVVVGQPRDDDVQSDRPVISGGLGHAFKK